MYKNGEFKTLRQTWSAKLELSLPEGTNIDQETLTLFYQNQKALQDEINNFVNILTDWIETKVHQLEEDETKTEPEKKDEQGQDESWFSAKAAIGLGLVAAAGFITF